METLEKPDGLLTVAETANAPNCSPATTRRLEPRLETTA
jgi:hypothetical protein